jgi:acetyltransferase-like isoleucine patch superfamily enzyme
MKPQIHPTAEVSEGAKIGSGTKVWHHVQVREDAEIGVNCVLGKNVYVDFGVKIGGGVKIQNNVSVYNGVTIEDDVFIGSGVCFTNDLYPRAKRWSEERRVKTLVKRGASIGANATIVCGNTIGEHAMVGAGSVVTKDIPDHALAYGNPAKVRGFVCECGRRLRKTGDKFKCVECGGEVTIPSETQSLVVG